MIHKGCGGEIVEDKTYMYEYEREDGTIEYHLRQICSKCGKEILGDEDIEDFEGGE
jgi:hypothetical protein